MSGTKHKKLWINMVTSFGFKLEYHTWDPKKVTTKTYSIINTASKIQTKLTENTELYIFCNWWYDKQFCRLLESQGFIPRFRAYGLQNCQCFTQTKCMHVLERYFDCERYSIHWELWNWQKVQKVLERHMSQTSNSFSIIS